MQRQQVKQINLQPEEIPYLIGPKGDTVSEIRIESGARVRFVKEGTREFAEIRGNAEEIEKAVNLIEEKLDNYHPHQNPTFQAIEPVQTTFSTTTCPFTAVIELPQGASRYYQNPQGRSIFGDLNTMIKLEKNQITLRAETMDELEENKARLERILTNFACVAIPAPIWAVGRIIGREGEGIQKIQQEVEELTGSECLVYFPEATEAEGIFSYAIVTSDDFRATEACIEIIIARLSAITEQGGVICDMFPSCAFELREVPETDLYCESYLEKMQLQHPGERLRIMQASIGVSSLISNFTSQISADEIIDRFPTIFTPPIQPPPQYYSPPSDQRPIEVLLPLYHEALGEDFDVSRIILGHEEFDVFGDFSLVSSQGTCVDRKFLVVSVQPSDLEKDVFWKNLVHFTALVLEMQFLGSSAPNAGLSTFCNIEFEAFPGKAVLMPKVSGEVSTANELSEALLRRDLTSRFIAGVSAADFESYMKTSKTCYYWRAQLCQRALIGGGNLLWHRVQVEKPVYLPARPTCATDFATMQDFPSFPVQIFRRAICVQIMVHLGSFVSDKHGDLLILLKMQPKEGENSRFDEYISEIQNLSSEDAFVNTEQYEEDEKDDEVCTKYGVASLPLPKLQEPDIFTVNEAPSATLNDSVPASPIEGMHPPNGSTRGQLIASETLSLEQPNATLIECRYKFSGNLAISHTDVVDFGATTDRRKYVVTLEPNCGSMWGNEGIKCASYEIEDQAFGTNLKEFVWECINICK